MKYVYPAIFTAEENNAYSVYFPDLEGCYTCGDNLEDALYMAEDVLAFTLYDYEKGAQKVPEASELQAIETNDNEFVNYITCDTFEYRKRHNNRAVKKTLTIPEWLNEEAIAKGINFSQVLQDGLKKQLGIF
ncbi:MAG: type II toxin-antitoxin system HicB family antitoxin [Bacillota bacterium]|nr:type II toxin-antitoxin system HicB family antitoxin [Bacillota bacterium]